MRTTDRTNDRPTGISVKPLCIFRLPPPPFERAHGHGTIFLPPSGCEGLAACREEGVSPCRGRGEIFPPQPRELPQRVGEGEGREGVRQSACVLLFCRLLCLARCLASGSYLGPRILPKPSQAKQGFFVVCFLSLPVSYGLSIQKPPSVGFGRGRSIRFLQNMFWTRSISLQKAMGTCMRGVCFILWGGRSEDQCQPGRAEWQQSGSNSSAKLQDPSHTGVSYCSKWKTTRSVILLTP